MKFLSCIFGLIAAGSALGAVRGTTTAVEARHLFIPNGYDNNDEVQVVLEGFLPDTCHKQRQAEVKVDAAAKKIVVEPRAQIMTGVCQDVTVPYTSEIYLGQLAPGTYEVQTKNGKLKERLVVKEAAKPTPDDHLYAPVDHASVDFAGGKTTITLYGMFTNSCLRIEDVKLTNSGKTLEILPIMKADGQRCQAEERPFVHRKELPELDLGWYLLHVRSLNGQAVNVVFTNLWK